MDLEATLMLLVDLSSRCNYWASVEGTVIDHRIVDAIWRSDHGFNTKDTLVTMEQATALGFTTIDFAVQASLAMGGFFAHWDPYNAAKATGSMVMLIYYMLGAME
eukprot:CAMPEP_0116873530 /NCGR_PEP_ID=MMETSP0463-20121206/4713_1 /TAXON_ID=181622 /ORGANISM="Strombidinopsis sp, Strain SopsisLIS2011" /LENGTH=104 /DNA_ID=CAMNT_0004515709 /DNA_START=307 /DNA_END=621 /DNA_ORIENTATION=-